MKCSRSIAAAISALAVMFSATAAFAQVNESDPAVLAARGDFAANAAKYGLVNPSQDLKPRSLRHDSAGVTHIRFDQSFSGIPIFEGQIIAHVGRQGAVTVTNGLFPVSAVFATTPVVSRENAAAVGRQALGLRGDSETRKANLEILPKGEHTSHDRLVWHFNFFAANDLDGTVSRDIFVDAVSGEIAWSFDSLETTNSTGNTMWSGTVTFFNYKTYLYDPTRGNLFATDLKHATSGKGTIFTSTNGVFGNGDKNNTDQATAGADAYFGAQKTWDFYGVTYGRNGIDNAGRQTYARTHYGTRYENAFWDNSCFCMTYGDGATTFYTLTSLDVTGHEFSHGVMASEANLTYSGESGGLNESNSDIFGTMVEFYANSPQDTPEYWIGERIFRSNWTNGGTTYTQTSALRYMNDPAKDGISPACWTRRIGQIDVHYSSGPNNHFFYLLSEGGPSKCNGQVVTGIGRDKAAAIWYKAMTDFMTPSTNYHTALTAVQSAATALYGAGSPEYAAATAAFAAINVTN